MFLKDSGSLIGRLADASKTISILPVIAKNNHTFQNLFIVYRSKPVPRKSGARAGCARGQSLANYKIRFLMQAVAPFYKADRS